MKKKCMVLMLVSTLLVGVTFPTATTVFAESSQSNNMYVGAQTEELASPESPINILKHYTVTDDHGNVVQEKPSNPFLREATDFHYKTVSKSIKKVAELI